MPYTMGSLYWQLNDCWPAASWSGIDSFGYWKPLQYQVQNSFRDVLVSFEKEENIVKVFVVNDQLESLSGELRLSVMDFEGKTLKEQKLNLKILPNKSSIATELNLKEFEGKEDQIFIQADYNNKKYYYYLVRPKDLKLKPSNLDINLQRSDTKITIILKSNTLEKDVQVINDEKPICYFSEILPGTEHEILIDTEDFHSEKLQIKVLNDFLNQK